MGSILFIVVFVVSTSGQLLGETINSTRFDTNAACGVALTNFNANVPNTLLNPTIAYCVPAGDLAPTSPPAPKPH